MRCSDRKWQDGKVEIAFEDGDFISVERGSFRWLPDPGGV